MSNIAIPVETDSVDIRSTKYCMTLYGSVSTCYETRDHSKIQMQHHATLHHRELMEEIESFIEVIQGTRMFLVCRGGGCQRPNGTVVPLSEQNIGKGWVVLSIL